MARRARAHRRPNPRARWHRGRHPDPRHRAAPPRRSRAAGGGTAVRGRSRAPHRAHRAPGPRARRRRHPGPLSRLLRRLSGRRPRPRARRGAGPVAVGHGGSASRPHRAAGPRPVAGPRAPRRRRQAVRSARGGAVGVPRPCAGRIPGARRCGAEPLPRARRVTRARRPGHRHPGAGASDSCTRTPPPAPSAPPIRLGRWTARRLRMLPRCLPL